MLYLKKNRY